jgi:hypothetical protein
MNLAERIYEISKHLPEPALIELLDFAEYLQKRKTSNMEYPIPEQQLGNAIRTLALLATPRFVNRPKASGTEVAERIAELRDEWGKCE